MEIVLGGAGAWPAATAMRRRRSGGEARCDSSPRTPAAILTSKMLVWVARDLPRGACGGDDRDSVLRGARAIDRRVRS